MPSFRFEFSRSFGPRTKAERVSRQDIAPAALPPPSQVPPGRCGTDDDKRTLRGIISGGGGRFRFAFLLPDAHSAADAHKPHFCSSRAAAAAVVHVRRRNGAAPSSDNVGGAVQRGPSPSSYVYNHGNHVPNRVIGSNGIRCNVIINDVTAVTWVRKIVGTVIARARVVYADIYRYLATEQTPRVSI